MAAVNQEKCDFSLGFSTYVCRSQPVLGSTVPLLTLGCLEEKGQRKGGFVCSVGLLLCSPK